MKNYVASWKCSPENIVDDPDFTHPDMDEPQKEIGNTHRSVELVEETHRRIESLWGYMAEAFSALTASSSQSEKRLASLEEQVETLSAKIESLSQSTKDTQFDMREDLRSTVEELQRAISEMRNEQREESRAMSDKVFDLLANRFHATEPSSQKTPYEEDKAPRKAITIERRATRQPLIPREELMRYVEVLSEEKPGSSVRRTFLERFSKKSF